MNIVLFGPQGSGKGTQADMLAKEFNLYHMSMGDELRKEIKNETELGKKIKSIVDSGALVPSGITNDIAKKIFESKEAENGVILDGYPRSSEQMEFVKENFKIDAAIELDLSEDESIKRIASRRICPKCGKNYNTIYLKPKVDDLCDEDQSELVQRDDDKPEEIKKRLEIYHTQTVPLKQEYSKQEILKVIDANQPIQKVYDDIRHALK